MSNKSEAAPCTPSACRAQPAAAGAAPPEPHAARLMLPSWRALVRSAHPGQAPCVGISASQLACCWPVLPAQPSAQYVHVVRAMFACQHAIWLLRRPCAAPQRPQACCAHASSTSACQACHITAEPPAGFRCQLTALVHWFIQVLAAESEIITFAAVPQAEGAESHVANHHWNERSAVLSAKPVKGHHVFHTFLASTNRFCRLSDSCPVSMMRGGGTGARSDACIVLEGGYLQLFYMATTRACDIRQIVIIILALPQCA